MRWLGIVLSSLGMAGAFAVGCGGKVVVDGPGTGTGGTGGTGSSTGTTSTGTTSTGTTSTGTTTTSTSSGTMGDIKQACIDACHALEAVGCGQDPSCPDDCVNTYFQFPDCQGPFYDAVVCMTNNASSEWCDEPPACQPIIEEFVQCAEGGNCSGVGCSAGPDGSCQCDVQCNGSNYTAACTPFPGGATCVCYIDQSPIGKCDSPSPDCDPYGGCCSQYFGL